MRSLNCENLRRTLWIIFMAMKSKITSISMEADRCLLKGAAPFAKYSFLVNDKINY